MLTSILYSNLTKENYSDIASRVGMLIPPIVGDSSLVTTSERGYQYVKDNLKHYETVLNRKQPIIHKISKLPSLYFSNPTNVRNNLELFTDYELFAIFGYYVLYDSRVNLIDNLLSSLAGPIFFIKETNICYGSTFEFTILDININKFLSNQTLYNLKKLQKLVNMFNMINFIENVNFYIEKKKEFQLSIFPASARWL